jgi:hypothetical protein
MAVCLDASGIGACGIRDAKIAQTYADRFGPTVFSLPGIRLAGARVLKRLSWCASPCKRHSKRGRSHRTRAV